MTRVAKARTRFGLPTAPPGMLNRWRARFVVRDAAGVVCGEVWMPPEICPVAEVRDVWGEGFTVEKAVAS